MDTVEIIRFYKRLFCIQVIAIIFFLMTFIEEHLWFIPMHVWASWLLPIYKWTNGFFPFSLAPTSVLAIILLVYSIIRGLTYDEDSCR